MSHTAPAAEPAKINGERVRERSRHIERGSGP